MIRIEFRSEGFKEILNSQGTKELVESHAGRIADTAGAAIAEESEGFSVNTYKGGYGGGRWISSVSTTDYASMKAESEHHVLSRAVF